MHATNANFLRFESLSKGFPGVRALQEVSFDARAGTVHALLGENGAGKSTLLKILSGVYRPDSGRLILNGQPREFHSAAAAINAGVAVIYQELNLVPQLSVAENLFLGHLPTRPRSWVDFAKLRSDARELLLSLGEDISPTTKVGALPIAQRQMVEIAKALSRESSVIAFDEPTSSLSTREVDRLFDVIRKLRAQGRVVLYVSHRMDEIEEVCDAATVLRDGRHIETFDNVRGVSRDLLVQRMVGRSISDVFHYTPRTTGDVVMSVRDLIGPGLSAPASFDVRHREILGFFGLVGAGRSELMKLIYGATKPSSGEITLDGKPTRIANPASAIRSGIVLCPEDRKREGIIPAASVAENVNLSGRRHFSPLRFVIHPARERDHARRQVESLSVRTPSLKQQIRNLSGGNQQKVILARWLGERINVMLLDEPTRGIDVGAKSEIYSVIYKLAEQGAAVVVVSSELPEVLGICDRIIVMRGGRIVSSLMRDQATSERLLSLALPVASQNELRMAV